MIIKKDQHRLSDTETLKIAFEAWPEHICSVPVGVFTFHGSQRKRNESEGVGRHQHKKKRVAPKASSCLIHLGCLMTFHAVFQDIFGFILLSPFSFSILWLGSSMVHPVHPDSFTFFLISKTFACRNFALLPYHQTFACIMDCGEMMGWEMGWEMGGDGWGCSWFS